MGQADVTRRAKAFEVGQLAQRLGNDYTSFSAVMESALHPETLLRIPPPEPENAVGVGYVRRKEGTAHAYWFERYLSQGLASAGEFREEVSRVWLSGALITLGDALTTHSYFDRAPELELVRHMRNAVAHGNRFKLANGEPRRPAHNLLAMVRGWNSDTQFVVTPGLEGRRLLFDWMHPGDILDVFLSVSNYLIRMGNGDYPLRPWAHAPDPPPDHFG